MKKQGIKAELAAPIISETVIDSVEYGLVPLSTFRATPQGDGKSTLQNIASRAVTPATVPSPQTVVGAERTDRIKAQQSADLFSSQRRQTSTDVVDKSHPPTSLIPGGGVIDGEDANPEAS